MDIDEGLDLSQVAERCYTAFLHTTSPESQLELMRALRLTEGLMGVTVIDDGWNAFLPKGLGGLVTREVVGPLEVEHLDASPEREVFIDHFEEGVDAFFPEGLLHSEKAELFSLAWIARQKPNGDKTRRDFIINARKDLIEAFIGRRYDNEEAYHGVAIQDVLETASWLRNGTRRSIFAGGDWQPIDPAEFFRLNPSLLKYGQEQIAHAAEKLRVLSRCPLDKLLASAQRGIYRCITKPERVEEELSEMQELGLLPLVTRRPDILNYPLAVLKDKEDAYVAMGIPLETVRSEAKFYVYKPETIQGRINLVRQGLAMAEPYLDKDEAELLLAEFCANSRFVLDCGTPKITAVGDLIKKYARPTDWAEVRGMRDPDNPRSIYLSVLTAFARTRVAIIEEAMEENPEDNIFLKARAIVNQVKARQKRTRRARQ
jgi:hypothetical protein